MACCTTSPESTAAAVATGPPDGERRPTEAGRARTVLGDVEAAALGRTSMHEHIFIDYTAFFRPPPVAAETAPGADEAAVAAAEADKAYERRMAAGAVRLDNLHYVQYHTNRNLDNLTLDRADDAAAELQLYRDAGGATIVDVTTAGIGRRPAALAAISRRTGLHVVMGAGFYLDKVHDRAYMDAASVAELAAQLQAEIECGWQTTTTDGGGVAVVRAGIIGELGCSWPLAANERKVLQAAAAAARRTGAAISIHPGRHETAPGEILDVLEAAGADLTRVVMGHLDRTVQDVDELEALARRGCVLEFDLFGMESANYPFSPVFMPNDGQRILWIAELLRRGWHRQIVIAHDVYTKHRLVKFGGHGYHHILRNVLPLMRRAGVSDEHIALMLEATPQRLLAVAAAVCDEKQSS